ncbi:hypothetical protein [Streptomyces boluensis]|uniref:Uncharacterized protein n=1 Tax=Streptomyces boluensis TaxID=1775135 RepID=A0A964ULN1_9ACTN|nr:hypothetical protein [Streptomyces boluensis]NBE50375.1 hypothetical protein [Streptomyces boluensis]
MACIGPANPGIALVRGAVPGTFLALSQVLPSERSFARDLGVVNVAGAALPQEGSPVTTAVHRIPRTVYQPAPHSKETA